MRIFIAAAIVNILLIAGLCISSGDNSVYENMTEDVMGALILATALDIPLLFTIPLAVFVRNLSAAVALIIVANIIFGLVVTDPLNLNSTLEIAVMSQVCVGLFIHRAIALWKKKPLVETAVQENFIYRKLAVPPLDWGWRLRVQNFINWLTQKLDMVSLPIVLLIITVSFAVQDLGGIAFAAMLYSVVWFLYLTFLVLPVLLVEQVARLVFSLSKTERPKEMGNIALAELSKLGSNLAERDIPGKAKGWIKDGFTVPGDVAKTEQD